MLEQKEARRNGLIWSRRKLAVNHLGYDPSVPQEESDEEAVEADQEMLARARGRLRQVQDPEYHFIPVEEHEPIEVETPKSKRVRILSGDDSLDDQETPLQPKDKTGRDARQIRDADSDEEEPEPFSESQQPNQIILDMLFPTSSTNTSTTAQKFPSPSVLQSP